MPLFIAKDVHGKVEDVVLANTVELASAYWHGKNITAHTVSSRSDEDLAGHPTGVLPIVSTRVITASVRGGNPKEIRIVD